MTYDNIKSHKKLRLYSLSKDAFLGKPQEGGGQFEGL